MSTSKTMGVSLAAMTLPVPFIVRYSAVEEPFYGVASELEAIVQIGLSSALIACWAMWITFDVALVVRRKLRAGWLLGAMLGLMCIGLLGFCAWGYAHDNAIASHSMIPQ